MNHPSHPAFPEQEEPKEAGFQEKRIHSFERQRLSEHAASEARKPAPVGAELEFLGYPRHHPQREINGKNPHPKSGGAGILPVSGDQIKNREQRDEKTQSHRQDWKEIVEHYR